MNLNLAAQVAGRVAEALSRNEAAALASLKGAVSSDSRGDTSLPALQLLLALCSFQPDLCIAAAAAGIPDVKPTPSLSCVDGFTSIPHNSCERPGHTY